MSNKQQTITGIFSKIDDLDDSRNLKELISKIQPILAELAYYSITGDGAVMEMRENWHSNFTGYIKEAIQTNDNGSSISNERYRGGSNNRGGESHRGGEIHRVGSNRGGERYISDERHRSGERYISDERHRVGERQNSSRQTGIRQIGEEIGGGSEIGYDQIQPSTMYYLSLIHI